MKLETGSKIHAQLFSAQPSEHQAQELFAEYVNTVMLEIFSYCNRRCAYCPVSKVDRISTNNYMEEAVLEQVLSDLKSINYSRRLCLNIYNEPMADPIIYQRIAQIKEALPDVHLYFNSNGDYMNRESLDKLETLGVKEIIVTLHPGPDQDFDDREILGRYTEFAARIGRRINFTSANRGMHYFGETKHRSLHLKVMARNYQQLGVNRANTVELERKVEREWPCPRPFDNFTIYYDGSVFPCCQFFPDISGQEAWRAGYIRPGAPIFGLYANKLMSAFRADLFTHGPKKSPCDTCGEGVLHESDAQKSARAEMFEALRAGQGLEVENFTPEAPQWRKASGE